MLVPKDDIFKAKNKLGDKAAIEIAEYFKLQNWDENDLKGSCPFGHKDDTPSFIWNPKNSSFHCFSCSRNFGILDLYMLQGLTYLGAVQKVFEKTNTKFKFSEKGVKTNRNYRYPHYEHNEDRTKVEKYLNNRCISKETLDYCDVQQDEKGNVVFHYYDLNDVLTLVKYRPSHKIVGKENKTWCQTGADSRPLLYNMNKIDPTDHALILTEGELDCLSVLEAGYKNVVSVPLGAGNTNWITEEWDFLEQFDKIIVWSDNDAPGINMRKEVCGRLGSWRTYYIELPSEMEKNEYEKIPVKDANDVLVNFGKQAVLDVIDTAQEMPIANIIDLSDVPDFDIETAPGLYSSFEELNKWVYKFILGTVVVITGRNGNGKSVWINQEFVAGPLEQGMNVFLYSAEMGKPILKNWVELVLAGRENVELKENTVHKINKEILKPMRDWYRDHIYVYDNDKDLSANSILDRLETVVRRYGVKVAVLDNLLSIDLGNATPDDLWQEQKKFTVKLVNFAAKYNILIVLVAHPRKTLDPTRRLSSDDIGGSGDITNLVHYVMAIHRYTKAEREGEKDQKGNYRKGKEPVEHNCALDLFKNRITGHANKTIKLFFDYQSYRFYTKPSELWKRYKWNTDKSAISKVDPNEHIEEPELMKDESE